jgi:transposase
LDVWIASVKRHGPRELRKALSAFRNWRQEILAFFDFLPTRLSNGFVEGKNNHTKALNITYRRLRRISLNLG